MREFRSRVLGHTLLTCLLATGAVAPRAASSQETDAERWARALRDLRPDPARGAMIQDLAFSRDVGIFLFGPGQMQLLAPIDGRTVGAVFVGEGRFQLAAPDAVEQAQLRRAFGADVADVPFRAAVLLFSDATLSQLESAGGTPISWGPLEPHPDALREIQESRDYFTDENAGVDPKIALPLLNAGPGFFYAHVSEDRGQPIIYSVDPHDFEEISLSRRAEGRRSREVVAQFHRRGDYASGSSASQEDLDILRVGRYDVTLTIDDDLDLAGRAAIALTRAVPGYDWVPFTLYSELTVDSVRWGNGSEAAFYRPEESSDLWVDLAGAPAEQAELVFYYSGEMLDRENGLWVALATHTSWLPVYQYGREVPYRLTFSAPEEFVVTSLGTQLSETSQNGITTRVFEIPPVRLVTFNIGEFKRFDSEPSGAPKLTVLVNENAHRRLAAMASAAGRFLLRGDNMAEVVANDLTNSFRFFGDVYGPTPTQQMVATEIPYSHGEAYDGLVMLAWSTFQVSDEEGLDDMFRAHEVAHQWWGISLRPATYRDRWLAEAFAEFSGWWFGASSLGSVELYQQRLREAREAIVLRRDEAAPVGLGTRVATSQSPRDYQIIVYSKGAWVLHMLKILLTDPDTGDDGPFRNVMRTFHTTYAGTEVTTRDFQSVVEQVVGVDMRWFFDQWIYGSAIPTYTFSYQLTDLPDGTVGGRVRIRQENVPDDFQMIVPILVDFGAEGTAIVRVNVRGPLTESDLPVLPREPDRIVFNPDESVLAETRTERWRN